ncbi:MAG: Crp/Fnr family transcriptional regulator [Sphingobacteriales bacterium]|nr:Crp/Fnr family transcriptional regulator [Sphingobacteriales bacterium]
MIDIDILLASGAKYKKVRKGEYLFHEGAVCNYYFQLVEGRVSWVNFDDEGKIFIQSILEPGECFGELPLFDDEPYAANAVAEVDSVIIQLPKLSFSQLLRNNFDIQVAFNRLLAQRVRYKFFILKEIACCSPEHRILTLLTYLSKKNNINNTEHFVVNYTRQQIAGMTGLRVETVIRVIRHLHDQGKLMIDKGKIIMPNHDYNHKIFA